jgi:predicted O-methyltransferase YrrM
MPISTLGNSNSYQIVFGQSGADIMPISTLINNTLYENEDSSQHYITLFALVLSLRARNVLELGVRFGHTTKPLLQALSYFRGHLTSVDIQDNVCLRQELAGISNWNFVVSDSLEFLKTIPDNQIYDLVFIDDWHNGLHVQQQLNLLDSHVTPSSLILMHDCMSVNTQPSYHLHSDQPGVGQDGEFGNGGPYKALSLLDKAKWEYVTIPVNHGLTILRKLADVVTF